MSPRTPRGVTGARAALGRAAVALVAVAVGATACSHTPASSVTTSSATGSTPTTAKSTTSSTSGTTRTTAAPTSSRCTTADLTASLLGSQGAAGTVEVTVKLTSKAAASCTLSGYPGIVLLDSSGTAMPTSLTDGGGNATTSFAAQSLTLAPRDSAYVNVTASDVPSASGACRQAGGLAVTPPLEMTALTVSVSLTACDDGALNVSPFYSPAGPEGGTAA